MFSIKGRGTVVTGRVERGKIKVGEPVEIAGLREKSLTSVVTGVEMVMPGDNVNLEVELIVPVALEQGSKFAIREGGLTVGAGVITKILD